MLPWLVCSSCIPPAEAYVEVELHIAAIVPQAA
jgi:hypothetical protein